MIFLTTEIVRTGFMSDPEAEYRDPVSYPAYSQQLGRDFDTWLTSVQDESRENGIRDCIQWLTDTYHDQLAIQLDEAMAKLDGLI